MNWYRGRRLQRGTRAVSGRDSWDRALQTSSDMPFGSHKHGAAANARFCREWVLAVVCGTVQCGHLTPALHHHPPAFCPADQSSVEVIEQFGKFSRYARSGVRMPLFITRVPSSVPSILLLGCSGLVVNCLLVCVLHAGLPTLASTQFGAALASAWPAG